MSELTECHGPSCPAVTPPHLLLILECLGLVSRNAYGYMGVGPGSCVLGPIERRRSYADRILYVVGEIGLAVVTRAGFGPEVEPAPHLSGRPAPQEGLSCRV